MKFIKPDFNNGIVNISATFAEFLGCPNQKPTLPVLENELRKDYKNIVFLLLDGLGIHPIDVNLSDDSFLKRNIRQTLTSVFPATTANATTSILTNMTPMEHGWFGWCLYFEELGRVVDLYPEEDSFTGEPIEKGYVKKVLPTPPFYKHATSGHQINLIVPEYWHGDEENRRNFHTCDEMFGMIAEACRRDGKQFIYAYSPEPDTTMHEYGVSSEEARRTIQALNDAAESLFSDLSDTLLVIAADHGQIDIGEEIELYRDTELTSLLEWPQYLEPRAVAFKVKQGCRERFAEKFQEKYGEDFALTETDKLIRENYFGGNIPKHAALLGDFIAIGKTDKILRLHERGHHFRGHHTSLTAEEMLVPLILYGKKS